MNAKIHTCSYLNGRCIVCSSPEETDTPEPLSAAEFHESQQEVITRLRRLDDKLSLTVFLCTVALMWSLTILIIISFR